MNKLSLFTAKEINYIMRAYNHCADTIMPYTLNVEICDDLQRINIIKDDIIIYYIHKHYSDDSELDYCFNEVYKNKTHKKYKTLKHIMNRALDEFKINNALSTGYIDRREVN